MNVITELAQCQQILGESKDIEDVLQYLRRNEYSQIDCIKMVKELQGIGLGEAKRVVHLSKAWSDVREIAEDLHDDIEKSMTQADE